MRDDLEEKMNSISLQSSSHEMADTVTYMIWGSVVTVTRAFEKVVLKIDPRTNRIFVSIHIRWWAKFKKFKFLQESWMRRAEERAKEYVPNGWKILIYYAREESNAG